MKEFIIFLLGFGFGYLVCFDFEYWFNQPVDKETYEILGKEYDFPNDRELTKLMQKCQSTSIPGAREVAKPQSSAND